ncbi:MAG: DUF1080 domain-containing protein [Planctomycetota bacterium]
MILRCRFRWLLAIGLACFSNGAVFADNTDKSDPKYTLTDPDGKDQDFDLQGEFRGTAQLSKFSTGDFGLQVVSMGGGRFQGQLLIGGLPGDGWNGFARIRLIGEREGRKLTLLGGPYAISLQGMGKRATVRFQAGDIALGELERVNRVSPTMGAAPGAGGAMLFSGMPPSEEPQQAPQENIGTLCWQNAKLTDEGLLLAGTKTTHVYNDFRLHVEFRTPFMPNARGQARANSGVYLNGRHEIQILDSFGLAGAEDEAGAIYKYKKPDLNMAFPPLAWQTYDIRYQAPVFNARGKKIENALITVEHNGVVVQDEVEVDGPTGAGPEETPILLPLQLQNHGAPVVFRNIWIAPINPPAPPPAPAPLCCRGRRCWVVAQ